MVTICQISKVNYAQYDEVWAIVRSLKYANPHVRHVPELSPSWTLFKLYMRLRDEGRWNKETFHKYYVPQFLKEMRGKEQQRLLNELFSTNKHICLVCFCTEEELCHRSIVGGMLQGAGLDVKGLSRDYSYYFDWWKNGVPGLPDNIKHDSIQDEKNISGYNSNIRYLYQLKLSGEKLFDEDTLSLCFTGRRPKDLCGYNTSKYKEFVTDLMKVIYEEFYEKRGVRRFITGGAQGFDQMAFWAVERMKSVYGLKDIQNVVFIPFEHQEIRWAQKGCFSIAEYRMMIKQADMIVVVCNNNSIQSMFDRNHAMCQYSNYCLGLYPDDSWNTNKGGTAECMRYAALHFSISNKTNMGKKGLQLLRLGYDIDDIGLHIGEMTAC